MNKKLLVLLVLFGLLSVSAVDEPSVGIAGEGDYETMQSAINNYTPINPDTGEPDFSGYKPFRTKADERIDEINEYVGPFSNMLFGVELSLSWIFIFSVVVWILLIELIIMPISEIFNWNLWLSLTGAGIIASLAMQGIGNGFVVWIESLMTAWYIGLVALVFGAVFGVVYSLVMKYLGARVKKIKEDAAKSQTEEDRAVIHVDRELAEKEIEGMGD